MLRTCHHPNCSRQTNRRWCGRHWHQLPEDLQRRYRAARSSEEKASLTIEAEELEQKFARRLSEAARKVEAIAQAIDETGAPAAN